MPATTRRTLAVAVVILVAFSTIGTGGLAQQQDGVERIDSCTIIDEPGRYVVSENFTVDGATQGTNLTGRQGDVDACLVVRADDVTLDGQGQTIAGTTGPASTPDSFVDWARARNQRPNGNATAGIVVHDPNGTVSDITITDVGTTNWYWGLLVADATDVEVSDGTFGGNVFGVELVDVTRPRIDSTTVTDSEFAGLWLSDVTNGLYRDSTVRNTGVVGVAITDSTDNSVQRLAVVDPGVVGIGLVDTARTSVVSSSINGTVNQSRPFVRSAGFVLINASTNAFNGVELSNMGRWIYYATNGSLSNTADLSIHGLSVEFTASDVAIRRADASRSVIGAPLLVTNTSDRASVDLGVSWGSKRRSNLPETTETPPATTETPPATTETPSTTIQTTEIPTTPPTTTAVNETTETPSETATITETFT
ncbi:MAG: right-handed parallel beta-helix repeat-containing protein [Haloarculaceae archaeon]